MVYTLDHLIEDCSSKKSRTDLPKNEKKKVLAEVWESFNHWIDAQFEKGKGINVATFGKITWEVTEKSIHGEEKRRPYFKLSETYCRGNGMPYKKQLTGPELAPMADINYSILAIRFSQTLTKDQVFTGLRDLLQQLGQVIGSGQKVAVQFHVGKLVAKDRKAYMLFDVQRFREYIDSGQAWNLAEEYDEGYSVAGEEEEEEPAAEDEPDLMIAPSDSLEDLKRSVENVPQLELNRPDTAELYQQKFQESLDREREQALRTPLSEAGLQVAQSPTLPVDDLDVGGDGGAGYEAREAVIEEAYKRHLRNMQQLVDAEDKEQRQMDEQRFQRELLAQMRRREQTEERMNLQTFIKKQIAERESQKQVERKEWMNATASSIPMKAPSFHVSGEDMSEAERHWQAREEKTKKDLLKSLKYQIDEKEAKRAAMKRHQLEEERRFLSHVNQEYMELKKFKQQQAEIKAKQMKNAWKRDNYMKTALKVRREQLSRTRPSPFQSKEQDDDAMSVRSSRSDYSVGFDVRSGR